MSGLEIVALVFGAIAAVKALPEIPRAWNSLFNKERKQLEPMPLKRVRDQHLPLPVKKHALTPPQQLPVARRDFDTHTERIVKTTTTTLQRYDDNRTAVQISNNVMHQSLDQTRYMTQTQHNEMMREVLGSWQAERVMFFDQISADQRLIIGLLVVVAVLMYLLGQYSAVGEYVRVLKSSALDGEMLLLDDPVIRLSNGISRVVLLPLRLLGFIWVAFISAAMSLGRSLGNSSRFLWRLVSSAVGGLGRGAMFSCHHIWSIFASAVMDLGRVLANSSTFLWRLVSSAVGALGHGSIVACSYIWTAIASSASLLFAALRSTSTFLWTLLRSTVGSLGSAATISCHNIWTGIKSGAGLLFTPVRSCYALIATIPFLWLGEMLAMVIGIGMWAVASGFGTFVIFKVISEGPERDRLPLIFLLLAFAAAGVGGFISHYLEFSTVTSLCVAAAPAALWNVVAMAHGVSLT